MEGSRSCRKCCQFLHICAIKFFVPMIQSVDALCILLGGEISAVTL
jgi:hypothetical protein